MEIKQPDFKASSGKNDQYDKSIRLIGITIDSGAGQPKSTMISQEQEDGFHNM